MRRVSDERGAVAVIVALLVVSMAGMAALVVDAGALYQERRELQNGADAAALAIAEDCARGLVTCAVSLVDGEAQDWADANAHDGTTNIDDADLDLADQQITVDTSTRLAGGGTGILFTFAKVFGFESETVHASATAEWGAPSGMTAVPLTVDECEFHSAPALTDITLRFHSGMDGDTGATPCAADPESGQDLPGGFGWLDGDAPCEATVDIDDGASADPGNDVASTGCSPSDFAIGSTIHVPIHSSAAAGGTNGSYTIVGFAAFVVTGYRLNGGNPGWYAPNSNPPCNPSQTCLRGHFTDDVVYSGELGGEDFGLNVIRLIG